MFHLLVGTLFVGGFMLSAARAQSLSNRPIRMVVPYTAGGPADLATRILAESIAPILGVPVVCRCSTRP